MNWHRGLKVKLRLNEPLKNRTTFKIGGKARYFSEPRNIKELSSLIARAKDHKIPICILGAGSNLLISDKGLNALVVMLNAPFFKKISFEDSRVQAGSSVMVGELLQKAAKRGLSGLEFLAGIPATVGGALAMNSGAWGRSIGKIVEEVQVMDYNGRVKGLKKRNIAFSYRKSSLAKYIILGASFRLEKKNKEVIGSVTKEYLRTRKEKQDYSYPNAGCVFRNPQGRSAGALIDSCGLKGKRIGGACISEKHANFIVNKGSASAEDVLRLMNLVKERVRNKFGIDLKAEVKIWK